MTFVPTILIIDDEPDVITYLTTLLSNHGFEAHSAESADEGLEKLERSQPDIIFLDLLMPMKTGINLFNKIKKDPRYRDIPVIIITGIQDKFSKDYRVFFQSLKRRKPAAFIEKPVNPDHLIKTVKQILGYDG